MPLLRTIHPFPDATFSLWQIAEAPSFFEEELPLSEAETHELSGLRDRRRLEWLSSRWLLHKTTGVPQRMPLAKDAFSKPFFLDKPDLFCSLSHSHGMVGALTALKPCGCDIQVLVEKMPRIAPKFLSEAERSFVQSFPPAVQFELFHLYWTGKESLYKHYGLKALDFRGHISLEAVQWDGQQGDATGFIQKDDFKQAYHLEFGRVELPSEQALIWAVCL
jgi:4'-phosphopantetheinyl transferase